MKLNEIDDNEQHQVKISNRFPGFESSDDDVSTELGKQKHFNILAKERLSY